MIAAPASRVAQSVVLAFVIVGAAAAASAEGFRTPSGNIACMFDDFDGPTVRCDIREHAAMQARPPGCDLDWGDAFEIRRDGDRGTVVCHGDTVFAPGLPVLAYGGVWTSRGLRCLSDPTGLTCLNGRGHGFRLSRAAQSVF